MIVQHYVYRESSHRLNVATSHIFYMVWLHCSPIPVGRKRVFFLPLLITNCLSAARGAYYPRMFLIVWYWSVLCCERMQETTSSILTLCYNTISQIQNSSQEMGFDTTYQMYIRHSACLYYSTFKAVYNAPIRWGCWPSFIAPIYWCRKPRKTTAKFYNRPLWWYKHLMHFAFS